MTTRRRYAPEDLTTVAGVRVTTPLQTLFELLPLLSPGAFVEAADGVLNTHEVGYDAGRPPQATLAEVAEFVHRHRGRRNIRRFAQAMERARPGSDSAPETRLRLLYDDHGIRHLVPGLAVFDERGVLQFQADLADEKHRISIQYEGGHHDAPGQAARDVRRARRTEELGWIEVRITKEDLTAQRWVDGVLLPVPVILYRRAVERRRAMDRLAHPDTVRE